MTGYRDEIGQTLCAARQAAGLTLGDVAARIRIKPVYLEAIEAGRFERLPALPQTLGFTRAYARHLKVDVEAPLAQLGEEIHRHIDNADFSAPELALSDIPLRRVGWVAAGAVLGVGLLAMMLFDFGPSPVADAPPVPARPVVAQTPARIVLTAPQVPAAPAAMPIRSVGGSSPVSAALAATLFDIETAAATAPEMPAAVTTPVAPEAQAETQAQSQSPVPIADLFVRKNVYLRAAPANAGRVLGVLAACEPLTALGTGPYGQWREVARADGVTGFVYHRFVGAEAAPACR